jgi:hypothetical protein
LARFARRSLKLRAFVLESFFFDAARSAPYIDAIMRPETQRSIDEIQQAIALLRRHL